MSFEWFLLTVAFLFGAVVGSFLNVCIHRLPRGESIAFPPSHCPGCGAKIRPWDNVPLFSYLFLRGRCRDCAGPISPLYPLVELLTALLFVVYTRRFGLTAPLLPLLILASSMVVIFFIDLDHQIIPNGITIPGMFLGLALTPLLPHSFTEGLIGLLGGGLFFTTVAVASYLLLKTEGMGVGDIKMAAMMGAFLGWRSLLVAVFLALLSGSAVSVVLLATGRRGRRDAVPFGPFLALGTLIASLWGPEILSWYLQLSF